VRVRHRVRVQLEYRCSRAVDFLYTCGIRSTKNLYLPEFLGIGAQKAGTTWLHENLRHHPGLYLPAEKEIHYFDGNFHKSLLFYSNKFKSGALRVKGEITPAYSIIPPERIRFIHTIMPEVRLIFLMRNPIDRAWSQALMNLVMLPGKQFEEVEESQFIAYFKSAGVIQRGDYLTILDNWLSIFPREQMYLGFFDDIIHQPKKLLCEVFSYLGVPQPLDWNIFPHKQRINKGFDKSIPEKYKIILEEVYHRHIEALYKRFGSPITKWLGTGTFVKS
jgi:hypothetical protein